MIIVGSIIWGAFTVVTWVEDRMGVSAQVNEVKFNADEIAKLLDSRKPNRPALGQTGPELTPR
ncbi:hypothetical protein [Mesorhizobium sp. M7A.F.Ca.US.001.02.1.1]|uniref:hypothetical protein n=1 Tax=Mesorhizobium sp. M7A.F.Ca.US.001.02.1.1 TaxID=2496703 RepID=UPI000FD4E53C|nr:hypothetical protein [Mesorhizobium sp. M7A.F.Ca.US.001.02.1.1]RVA05349.1 hypothetical protein EN938_09745 [Mesorhizobium sp. M7A.F.Ca.US.001.02.1.1]